MFVLTDYWDVTGKLIELKAKLSVLKVMLILIRTKEKCCVFSIQRVQ